MTKNLAKTAPTQPEITPARALSIPIIILTISGCASSLEDIDAQVDRLIAGRTSRLDPGAAVPRPTSRDDQGATGSTSKTIETSNKPAAELRFTPADEARDVNARLNAFSLQSLGTDITPASYSATPESSPSPAAPAADPASLPLEISFEQALRLAQSSAREFKTAEEDYILSAIRLLSERHLWTPRLSNTTTLSIDAAADNARFENALKVINDLKVTQRLPFGGQAEAAWVWDATEHLRNQVASSRYSNASELSLGVSIPLLKDAGLIAQESLIQSERNLIYSARNFERFRRQLLVQVANDYFTLVQTQARIANQQAQLQSLRTLAQGTAERVKAGRINPFEQAITENSVLSAESALAGLRDGYILQLDRFKLRLGLDVTRPITVKPFTFDLPEPDITLDDATALALDYRLDLQNRRDQLDDTRRSIANARNQLLPSLDLGGRVGIPTDRGVVQPGLEFDHNDAFYNASVTLGLPLDKEIERLNLRQSLISLERAKRDFDQARDDVVISVRRSIRGVELARFQLRLAEQGVKIAERRVEEQRLKSDSVEPQKIVDSENALVDARNARDQARTDLRNSVLNYLLESDQLRVSRDGTLERLPGMETTPAEPR